MGDSAKVNPIELKARREALGLSQGDLAALLGVKQVTISTWENGNRAPRDPSSVLDRLSALEDVLDAYVSEIVEQVEHASAVRNTPAVEVTTYATDSDWWEVDARAKAGRLPAALHRVAAAHACAEVRAELDLLVSIRV